MSKRRKFQKGFSELDFLFPMAIFHCFLSYFSPKSIIMFFKPKFESKQTGETKPTDKNAKVADAAEAETIYVSEQAKAAEDVENGNNAAEAAEAPANATPPLVACVCFFCCPRKCW